MKKCIYCDTIYPENSGPCPLCGGSSAEIVPDSAPEPKSEPVQAPVPAPVPEPEQPRERSKPAPKQEPEEKKSAPAGIVPRWMTVLTCVVIVAALLVGVAFTGYSLGLFNREDTPPVKNPSLDLPYDNQTDVPTLNVPGDNEPDEPTEPDVPTEPDEPIQDPTGNPPIEPDEPDEPTDEPDEPDVPTEPDEPDEPAGPQNPCTGLSLSHTDVTLFKKGETFKLKATVSPEDCDESVIYESADTSFVTVDADGTVTARNGKGGGSVIVTVTCGEYSEECIVRLAFAQQADSGSAETDENAGGYSLSITDFTMSIRGEEVTVEVENVNLATDTVTWTIDDPTVASIQAYQDAVVVNALATGTTTLRATVNGSVELTCIVRCSANVSGETQEDDNTAETG